MADCAVSTAALDVGDDLRRPAQTHPLAGALRLPEETVPGDALLPLLFQHFGKQFFEGHAHARRGCARAAPLLPYGAAGAAAIRWSVQFPLLLSGGETAGPRD